MVDNSYFILGDRYLREKYTNEHDHEKLKLLDEFNDYAMLIQKKYENA